MFEYSITALLVSFTGQLGFTSATDVNRLHSDHDTIECRCPLPPRTCRRHQRCPRQTAVRLITSPWRNAAAGASRKLMTLIITCTGTVSDDGRKGAEQFDLDRASCESSRRRASLEAPGRTGPHCLRPSMETMTGPTHLPAQPASAPAAAVMSSTGTECSNLVARSASAKRLNSEYRHIDVTADPTITS